MANWLVFVLGAAITLLGAAGVLAVKNPVHSALLLVQTLFGVAILFVAQQAHFLAAVQIIVYAGAVVVLFLFVIMLIGVDRSDAQPAETIKGQRVGAAIVGALILLELAAIGGFNFHLGATAKGQAATSVSAQVTELTRLYEKDVAIVNNPNSAPDVLSAAQQELPQVQQALEAANEEKTKVENDPQLISGPGTNVEKLSEAVFTKYLFPFEITSVLLVIAVVGAVLMARKPKALDGVPGSATSGTSAKGSAA
jgi:NADH-quinone oxidoreductase subunit J